MRMMASAIFTCIAAHGLGGCTTSEFFIGAWYDQLDDTMVEQFSEYADFSKRQRSWIEDAAAEYHVWHRKTQLPLYSRLLRTIKNDISNDDALGKNQVENWTHQIDELIIVAITCHPLNRSADFLGELTERQVAQVGDTIQKKIRETKDEGSEERLDNAVKWGRWVGLKFNDQQRSIIQTTLARETGLDQQKRTLLREWAEEFLSRLERREAVDFRPSVQKHISRLWRLAEDAYPEESRYNRELWLDSIHEIFLLQTPRQREEFTAWLDDMAIVLESLSRKTVRSVATLTTRNAAECRL